MVMNSETPIIVKPIGVVVEGLPEEKGGAGRYNIISTIRVLDEYKDGLKGLEDYSHAFIIYWMDRAPEPRILWKPWGREDLPEVGVFATRFPGRPNPIGLSLVEIVEVGEGLLRVRGLDAWSGTPVIDIKPYDYYDIVCCPRIPAWMEGKWREARSRDGVPEWLGPCC